MGRKRNTTNSIAGTYEISTGELVVEPDPFRDGAFILNVNGVPSSHLIPEEPRTLEFEYMRWIAAAVENLAPGKRLLHLGGGGCSPSPAFADLCRIQHRGSTPNGRAHPGTGRYSFRSSRENPRRRGTRRRGLQPLTSSSRVSRRHAISLEGFPARPIPGESSLPTAVTIPISRARRRS